NLLTVLQLPRYEYICFCPLSHDCQSTVYAPCCQMLNVTDMENKTTSRYNSTRKPTMYEFHPGTFIIHSTSALQVVVIFKRNGTFERSSCSILPSNLFMTEYLAKLPNEFSEHAIIIIAVGSLQDYVLNNMTLNT
ncbi:hypothetical protein BgiMline_036100, partial [Biomphalaria glabrata]